MLLDDKKKRVRRGWQNLGLWEGSGRRGGARETLIKVLARANCTGIYYIDHFKIVSI